MRKTRSPIPGVPLGRLGTWALFGVVLTTIFLISDLLSGIPLRPVMISVLAFLCSAMWLSAAPLIWRLADPLPLSGPHSMRHGLVHLSISIAMSLVLTTLYSFISWCAFRIRISPEYPFGRAFQETVYYFLLANVLFYWLVLIARRAFDFATALQDEEMRATRMKEHLTQARLDALRAQMHPHFLFNALNSISALVRTGNSSSALDVLSRVGSFLRASLSEDARHKAPLENEIEVALNFIEIERCRLGDRLDFHREIDESLLECLVPRWLLQPLLENAFVHGLHADANASQVLLRAKRQGESLLLEVENEGPPPHDGAKVGLGIGHTRARMKELYGDRAQLDMLAREGGGTRIRIVLPLDFGEDPQSQ